MSLLGLRLIANQLLNTFSEAPFTDGFLFWGYWEYILLSAGPFVAFGLSGTFMASEVNLMELRLMESPGVGKGKPRHTTALSLLLKGRLTCTFSPGWFSLIELLSIEEIFSWQGRRKQGKAGCAPACGK